MIKSGLRTRSIFNRVQVRVQEIFANPSSSSSSKNFIFRVQEIFANPSSSSSSKNFIFRVQVRQKRPSSSSQPWTL